MKFSSGKIKRVFIVRLEDRECLPDIIENFAKKQKIKNALCLMIGGTGKGKIVAGPEKPNALPIIPIIQEIKGVSEILGLGTIFLDENNLPRLHMHAVSGRGKRTLVGCIRPGITVWKIIEFVIIEITGTKAKRKKDNKLGFLMLET